MPVTRSVGKGRKIYEEDASRTLTASETENNTSTEATTSTGATTSTEATTSTRNTTSTEATKTTQSTAAPSTAVPHEKRMNKDDPKQDLNRPPSRKGTPPPSEAPKANKAGSTRSKTRIMKIARAKEDLLRIQAQLAAAVLARLEHQSEDEEEEEDKESVFSKSETNIRVDSWLNSQPLQPQPPEEETEQHTADAVPTTHKGQNAPPRMKKEDLIVSPAGVNMERSLASLTTAITSAIKAGNKTKFTELPEFTGSHKEWLPFRAAYRETEKQFSKNENINRLRRILKGKAREAVQSLLINSTEPARILEALETRFGRPESIAKQEVDSLRALPRVSDSPRDICIFATQLTNAVATLESLDCAYYMYSPELSTALLEKTTPSMRLRFYEFAETQPRKDPALSKFEKFIRRQAELCAPYAQPEEVVAPRLYKQPQRINTATEQEKKEKCPVCDEEAHHAADCAKFKKADTDGRWDIAKDRRLCFRCLRYRGRTHTCKAKPCGTNDCKHFHHKMLHNPKREKPAEPAEKINSAWTKTKQSLLKIIPVEVSGPQATVKTFALLDDGSTVTLIDEELADSIGAKGPVDPLYIEAIHAMKTTESQSRRVAVTLKGVSGRSQNLQGRTIRNLKISPQQVSKEQIKKCKHLRHINGFLSYENARPRILIGQDNWHLLLATKTKKGSADQPVASFTPLGWVLHGAQTRSLGHSVNFVSCTKEAPAEDDLEEIMKRYFAMDSLCVEPKKPKSDPEAQALQILEKNTVHMANGSYQTALLWRNEGSHLPNNYDSSLRRLHGIEKKLDRDEALKTRYRAQMNALIEKGYAEPAPANSTPDRTWYLPHFAVINPMKPEKLRVVHDAAAKTRGVSLNDMLLKGPDLLQSLPGVVMRFRQHAIAVTADIKEMFMQVKLRPADRDALRYLWRDDRRDDRPPEEYRMTSLIFGASCSPSTAIFVKDHNARKYETSHPEASAAVINNHYVDDYLDSFKSVEEAIRTVAGVREIHRNANYELKQWKSNSLEVLKAVGEEGATHEMELYDTGEKSERVLGLIWKVKTDELTFNLNLARIPTELLEGRTPTKRQALRIVMSLFDPLGLASPVTIRAKQLLQEVWRRGTEWDEELPVDLAEQWKAWMSRLFGLDNVSVPRRYLEYTDAVNLQLHVFTDASESAYSAALYWRATTPSDDVSLSLIIAKAKVAPLKLTSIPRLELQAALMGARLAEAVLKEHPRKPDSKTYWTDSKTVLIWLKTGSRSYKPYVAHRLAAIEELSTVSEWRWIPTKMNVADDATRDVPAGFNSDHRWYAGPEFLLQPEATWPPDTSKSAPPPEPTEEERTHHVTTRKQRQLREGLPDCSRFSNWHRLRNTTARVLQFIELCRAKRQSVNYKRTKRNTQKDPDWKKASKNATAPQRTNAGSKETKQGRPLSAELVRKAEDLLMRSAQQESFPNEIEHARDKKPVATDSRLRHLSIEYVGEAVRLQSRIDASEQVPAGIKNQLVLDANHHLVKLWIASVHRTRHHAGIEATVNECQQHYWLLRLRPIVKSIVRRCLHCRMRAARPPHPRTGDLPPCRLAHHQRPFTYTGLDYFGPLSVTVGRSHQKRYVALFTCLTVRAVHLEIATSLSTDSAVMALRRMMARRGQPVQLWSDNGTNLKGADRELRQALDAATAAEAAHRKIAWRFIPPGAPFMGGAWERMVRSVKTALEATLHERHPTEEVLATLLTEVEYTINSRPLTHVSTDDQDREALTPNHFILGGPGQVATPGEFQENDTLGKYSWRAAQRLADVFWKRWLREYLPGLRNRREPRGRGPAVKVNDLVQLLDTNSPRNVWIRGRISAVYPGPDDVVRTVDVATKGGVLRRAVRKLVILPTEIVDPHQEDATGCTAGEMCRTTK